MLLWSPSGELWWFAPLQPTEGPFLFGHLSVTTPGCVDNVSTSSRPGTFAVTEILTGQFYSVFRSVELHVYPVWVHTGRNKYYRLREMV